MRKNLVALLSIVVCCGFVSAAEGAVEFVIRSTPTIQPNNDYVAGATEFIISGGGMKAGIGIDDINGSTIADITSLSITRHDDTTRFSAGSGPAVAPYFNLWVTDGGGNYAVIANEPSNGAFQPLFTANVDGSKTYDLSYTDLADKRAKVYETPGWNSDTSWVHGLFGNDPLTFADIATLEIAPPPSAYINNAANGVGSGAPDTLEANPIAYGFNWVFGDTLSNYVSGDEGYVVSNYSAAAGAVPEPTAIFVWSLLGTLGIAASRRRRQVA